MIFIAYLIIGILTGVLSGLFGLGGGVIMVPALMLMFAWQDFPKENMMQLASGTSLGAMIITTVVTIWSQHKRGAVQWQLVRFFLPGTVVGALSGVFFAQFISTPYLKICFAIFIAILGGHLIWGAPLAKSTKNFAPVFYLLLFALGIGILAGMLGLGGGVLLIPLFLWLGLSMVQASATSAACAFPTALAGACMAVMVGWDSQGLPPRTWGFIYWPGALSLGLASVISIPFGVALAHTLPVTLIKRIFGVVLWLLAIQMLWRS